MQMQSSLINPSGQEDQKKMRYNDPAFSALILEIDSSECNLGVRVEWSATLANNNE